MRRFDEATVFAAFDTLGEDNHAAARAAYEFAEKQLKVILAKAEIASNGKTIGERQASALASPEYDRALSDFRLIPRLTTPPATSGKRPPQS